LNTEKEKYSRRLSDLILTCRRIRDHPGDPDAHLHDIESGGEVSVGVNRIIANYRNATVTWNTAPSYVPVSGGFSVCCQDWDLC
jgi:hypothetical protein